MPNPETKPTWREGLITHREVLERTGLSSTTIWKWTKTGRFPAPVRPGGPLGNKFYKESEVEDFEAGKYRSE